MLGFDDLGWEIATEPMSTKTNNNNHIFIFYIFIRLRGQLAVVSVAPTFYTTLGTTYSLPSSQS